MKVMTRTLAVAATAALLTLPAASALAVFGISGTSVTGNRGLVPLTPGIDHVVFAQLSPGVLSPTLTGTVQNVMGGNKAAPGGNVELFADSEAVIYRNPNAGGAFQNHAPTVLTGNLPQAMVVKARSLNGSDWFKRPDNVYDTSYNAPTLANFWFNDFTANTGLNAVISALPIAVRPIAKVSLYETFRDGGGFARLSDPNIAYINRHNNGEVRIGLAGNFDLSDEVRATLTALELTNPLFNIGDLTNLFAATQGTDPFQFSEIVAVMIDGKMYYLYGFDAEMSGLVNNDQTKSGTGIYELIIPGFGVIPEPLTATLGLMAMGALGLTVTRRQRG